MGRKVAFITALVGFAVVSVVLVGGQVGTGRFFENGNHEPIYIFGDRGFTEENGVRSGDGSRNNPYVIEGWLIDAPNADYGIYVDHTTKYFVVRGCVVDRARLAGIYFNTVKNGLVEGTQISLSDTAVFLLNSQLNKFSRNVVMYCRSGVVMGARAMRNVISENAFIDNGRHGYDPTYANQWFEDCRGNYWSDYDGCDRNGDGIGDVPYYVVRDMMPLMAPPSVSCEEERVRPEVIAPAEPVVIEEPAAEEAAPAIVEEPQEPAEEQPLIEPVVEEELAPAAEPIAEEPVIEEPAVEEPEEQIAPAEQPVTEEPAVEEPGVEPEALIEEESEPAVTEEPAAATDADEEIAPAEEPAAGSPPADGVEPTVTELEPIEGPATEEPAS